MAAAADDVKVSLEANEVHETLELAAAKSLEANEVHETLELAAADEES